MGYSTDFRGSFKINEPVTEQIYKDLVGLATTRRMRRDVDKELYGIDGEFYFLDDDEGILDYNRPPRTQPGLWCQWRIHEDKHTISWDGNEKFYHYTEWLEYIIDRMLKPAGYTVNGEVEWRGEDWDDRGTIQVIENVVIVNA